MYVGKDIGHPCITAKTLGVSDYAVELGCVPLKYIDVDLKHLRAYSKKIHVSLPTMALQSRQLLSLRETGRPFDSLADEGR